MSVSADELLGYSIFAVIVLVLVPLAVVLTYAFILKRSPKQALHEILQSTKMQHVITLAPYEFMNVQEASAVYANPQNKVVFVDGTKISSLDGLMLVYQTSLNRPEMDLDWLGLELALNDCEVSDGLDLVLLHEFLPKLTDEDLNSYFATIFWYWRYYSFFHNNHGCRFPQLKLRIIFVVHSDEHQEALREMFMPFGKYFGTIVVDA